MRKRDRRFEVTRIATNAVLSRDSQLVVNGRAGQARFVRKQLLATLPQVMQEAMQIGQAWGQKIGKEAADEAEKEMKKK